VDHPPAAPCRPQERGELFASGWNPR
jgi:hypothetical protein